MKSVGRDLLPLETIPRKSRSNCNPRRSCCRAPNPRKEVRLSPSCTQGFIHLHLHPEQRMPNSSSSGCRASISVRFIFVCIHPLGDRPLQLHRDYACKINLLANVQKAEEIYKRHSKKNSLVIQARWKLVNKSNCFWIQRFYANAPYQHWFVSFYDLVDTCWGA